MRQSNSVQLAMSRLSPDELRSVLFLLLDFFPGDLPLKERAQEYIYVIQHPDALENKVRNICARNPHLIFGLVWKVRNFKLLKELGFCKHDIPSDFDNITPFWSTLYSICEEIDENEFQMLKRIFLLEDKPLICVEELICHLFRYEKIFETDLSELSSALQCIRKTECIERIMTIGTSAFSKLENYDIPRASEENPSGIAFIINEHNFNNNASCHSPLQLRNREGSSFDRQNLEYLWHYFGMRVRTFENLTAQGIESVFMDFIKDVPTYCHIFVACLLSHGDTDVIYGSDATAIQIDRLVSIVANNCPMLNNKPKIFVIQACQGSKQHEGAQITASRVTPPIVETDAVRVCKTPEYCDVYKALATIPGYVSYRSPQSGSLFISEFTKLMKQYGHLEDIDQTMKRVKGSLSSNQEHIQMPVTSSTLRKNVIFKQIGH